MVIKCLWLSRYQLKMTIILCIIFTIKLFFWYCYTVNIIFRKGDFYRLDFVREIFLKDSVN